MQSDKLMIFWCWLQTCININLLTGLCFPLGKLSTGWNQSLLIWSIKMYDCNMSAHSVTKSFWLWRYRIQTKCKKRHCSIFLIIPIDTIMNRHFMRQQITCKFIVSENLLLWDESNEGKQNIVGILRLEKQLLILMNSWTSNEENKKQGHLQPSLPDALI